MADPAALADRWFADSRGQFTEGCFGIRRVIQIELCITSMKLDIGKIPALRKSLYELFNVHYHFFPLAGVRINSDDPKQRVFLNSGISFGVGCQIGERRPGQLDLAIDEIAFGETESCVVSNGAVRMLVGNSPKEFVGFPESLCLVKDQSPLIHQLVMFGSIGKCTFDCCIDSVRVVRQFQSCAQPSSLQASQKCLLVRDELLEGLFESDSGFFRLSCLLQGVSNHEC